MALRRHLEIFGVAVCVVLASFALASAQSVSSGTIHGTIRDQSGGVLPGVTATLTSPALQVPAVGPGDRRRRRISLR